MRFVLVTALFALMVGTSLPAAAAGASDHLRERDTRERAAAWTSDDGPQFERRDDLLPSAGRNGREYPLLRPHLGLDPALHLFGAPGGLGTGGGLPSLRPGAPANLISRSGGTTAMRNSVPCANSCGTPRQNLPNEIGRAHV